MAVQCSHLCSIYKFVMHEYTAAVIQTCEKQKTTHEDIFAANFLMSILSMPQSHLQTLFIPLFRGRHQYADSASLPVVWIIGYAELLRLFTSH